MTQELRNYVKTFFLNCGSEVSDDKGIITVKNIPKSIKDFLGRDEPYFFSIGEFIDNKAEVITQGSFILKVMNDYLQNKGQTTLLKIDFSNAVENMTIPVILKECELFKQDKKEIMDKLVRFTFSTDFQYLNEREQILKEIYVKNNELINVNLDNIKLVEGNSKDITYQNVEFDYVLAKNSIKHELKEKITSTSVELKKRLEKEIDRINHHYDKQKEELTVKLTKLNKQLDEAKKENDEKKINRLNQEIIEIDKKINDKIALVEKEFFTQDEINKHSLNLKTSLLNTTIIYYSNYKFDLHLKNKKSVRTIQLDFDPFNNKLSNINCDSCKFPLKELFLCSSGHIACANCKQSKCCECDLIICKSCTRKECNICNHNLCRKCNAQCSVCLKTCCSKHGQIEKSSQKLVCNNCGRNCCKCNGWFDNKKLKLYGPKKICEACLRIAALSKDN